MTNNEVFAERMRAKREGHAWVWWPALFAFVGALAVFGSAVYALTKWDKARADLADVIAQRDDALKVNSATKKSLEAKTKRAKSCDLVVKGDIAFQAGLSAQLDRCKTLALSCADHLQKRLP